MTFPALPRGWHSPPARCGGRAARAGPGGPGGQGLCKDKALLPASLPARCSLTLLLEESQQRGEVPAHENHHGGRGRGLVPRERGAPQPPEDAQPVVPALLSPRGYRRGGCRRPPAPSLRPHPRGREDARPGEDAPAQLLESREQPEPGTAARWQEGTVPGRRGQSQLRPPRSSAAGEGKRGPLLWPPALPPPPTHGTDHSDLFFQARGQHFPYSSLLDPWDSPGPCWAQQTSHSLPQQCGQLGGTGRNWEAFAPWQ